MNVLVVDLTQHLQLIFNFINNVYEFLLNVKFIAFGFEFSLLGIFLALMLLIIVIKFMKFGFESETSSLIRYSRVENKKNTSDYVPRHVKGNSSKSRWI